VLSTLPTTRCPTECKLTYSTQPWKCTVSLQLITDEKGQPRGETKIITFGDTIYDKSEVEERIRRAQRAILNPLTDWHKFLEGVDEDPDERQRSFSRNSVCLQISGNDVTDLSFCDLPGSVCFVFFISPHFK
jgi:hypothetical protein